MIKANKKITMAVVDDIQLFRKGIIELIKKSGYVDHIFEFGNGQELIDKLNQGVNINLIFLDIKMPKLNGYETAKILRKKYPKVNIIILSEFKSEAIVNRFIELGVQAILFKSCEQTELNEAIKKVVNNNNYFSVEVAEILALKLNQNLNKNSFLSDTEKNILELMSIGTPPEEIAEKLKIKIKTFQNLKSELQKKTKTKSSYELLIYAIENNLIDNPTLSLFKNKN